MTPRYRLATADANGTSSVYIEHLGLLLPLAALLDEAGLERLGGSPPQDLMPLLQDWSYWRDTLPELLSKLTPAQKKTGVRPQDARFRPPVIRPGKLICIGANYHDHIQEMKIPMLPTYPYSFLKPPSTTLRGSGETVMVPAIAKMLDWEAELAVIIGARAFRQPLAQALDVVAGYANLNDLSARDWLANSPGVGVDWVRHKAFDGFAPMGPYMLPAEFVPNPQSLPVKLSVNGVIKQNSNTAQMVFGVAQIIEYLTEIMTLEPGDIIATGTPAGTGYGQKPQQFLQPGDVVRIEIDDLGVLETPIIQPS